MSTGEASVPASTRQSDLVAESVFGSDDRTRVADTSAFPWTAIGQITVTGNGVTQLATGVMISPQHMLTAGHAVLSDSFGGDGAADRMTVDFGEGGVPGIELSAEMVEARVLPGWESARDVTADLALVTLDRSVGAVTGSFDTFAIALTDFFEGINVNIAGYPADIAAGQALTLSSGQIHDSTDTRLFYNGTLDTAGGMSGAPIWQFFPSTGDRQLIGIHTTGVSDTTAPGAANGGTRLTTERLQLIDEWIGQDLIQNPPDDRADLAVPGEAMVPFAARFDTLEAEPGGEVAVTLNLANLGTAASAGFDVTFYLSNNTTITEFDIAVGSARVAGLAPLETHSLAFTGTLPDVLPTGSFFFGWQLDSGETIAEFEEGDNTGIIAQSIDVVGQALPNLIARDLSLGTTDWQVGQSVDVAWTLANDGVEAAGATGSVLLLSPDAQITASDRVLLDDGTAPALAAGGQSLEGQPGSFTVPGDLAPGTWYVAALADPDDLVAESAEGDNLSAAIAVTVINAPPVAAADTATTAAGQAVTIPVLANDTDPEGRGLTLVSVAAAAAGGVRIEGDKAVYTPSPGFSGVDGFSYTVADADGATATAAVSVTVTNAPPVAAADTATTAAGQAVTIPVLANDTDPEGRGLTLVSVAAAAAGGVRIEGDKAVYTPSPGFSGVDGFSYTVADADGATATAAVSVTVTNAPPVAAADTATTAAGQAVTIPVLANDTDPEGRGLTLVSVAAAAAGGVRIESDKAVYTPSPGFSGVDGFSYTVADADGATATAAVSVTVAPPDPAISGTPEADRLQGADVAETISGGDGDDLLDGGGGADTLDGGAGADTLLGRVAAEMARGGPGADMLTGGAGADILDGGTEADRLFGGDGADSLVGGAGADTLGGGAGDDTLEGGEAGDLLFGDAGVDLLQGGAGGDLLAGGAGTDLLIAGRGDDEIEGGAGADVFRFAPGDGIDRMTDFAPGEDLVEFVGLDPADGPSIGTGAAGEAVLAYGDAGDSLTFAGLAPEDLDGHTVFLLA